MSFFSIFADNLGMDLGTANTVICSVENGILLNEPSIVAMYDDYTGKSFPYAFGKEAKMMLGKTPNKIETIRPMKDGVIADFRAAGEMIKYFIGSVSKTKSFFGPLVIVCVPSGSTPVERKAIQESIEISGAREVFLVEEPTAAAIGANLPIMEATGSIVVDIGGGTTEIGILSLGGIVYGKSIRVAGDKLDEAIIGYMKKEFNLLIGETSAEKIKMNIGIACAPIDKTDGQCMEIRGRDLTNGIPKEITINERQMSIAINNIVEQIIEAVKIALDQTPPEISSDIVERGIFLTGGGAMLKNLDYVLSRATNLPVFIAEDPLFCVVNGIKKILSNLDTFRSVLFKQE